MGSTGITSANVADFLLEGREPDRIALLPLGRSHTYGELQAAAGRIARYCLEAGGAKGDRVVLVGENSFFWAAAYLGVLRAGCVCVPLPPAIAPLDLRYILQVAEARITLCDAAFATKNAEAFRGMHVLTDRTAASLPGAAEPNGSHVRPSVSPDDLAALMFTSGSTGKPRGVMVSHGNILANTESIIASVGLTGRDRMMCVLPFHYCFGTSLLHTHLRVGGSLVMDSRFLYPEMILRRMIETECTGFAGVPSHFQILLRKSSLRKKTFPHLRHVQQAGGHLAPNFIRELREALPGTQLFIMYGQTEATARLSCLAPEFLETKLGSIGKGIPGVTLRVLNQSGEETLPGEVGEIVAEGGNVTRGYWGDCQDAATFRDGKLYTGDLATRDEEGFLYIVDRARDFLKCGGKRVSCRQIEDQLLAFEGLLEAAVIGVPDDVLGEAVKAFVVARERNSNGLSDSLRTFCREHMPPVLVPREITVLEALPKNSAGKVMKPKLRTL